MTPASRPLGRLSRELARRELAILVDTAGATSAVLFSPDGFEIASQTSGSADAGRLAAIGSSLAALGSAISGEVGLSDFERTTIESRDGTVLIMRVQGSKTMSLAVVAGQSAVLGTLLWAVQRCCQTLGGLAGE